MLDSPAHFGHSARVGVRRAMHAVLVTLALGACSDSSETAPATTVSVDIQSAPTTSSRCDTLKSATVPPGDVAELDNLTDAGRLGATVLVAEVVGAPTVAEDSLRSPVLYESQPGVAAAGAFLVTRYDLTIRQLVVWPDSAPTPAIGDRIQLDVAGGTSGCFTLIVPNAARLEPGTSYLVTAGVRQAHQLVLWDDRYALRVTDDGIIQEEPAGSSLPVALTALVGQSTDSLPPTSVVHSELIP